MFLQHRAKFFQTLSVRLGQWIVHLIETTIDPQERGVLIRWFFVDGEEAINAGPQHRGITAHEPELFSRLADEYLLVETQLGQDLAPALGDRLLDDGQVEDPALDHLQHVLDGKARIDPFDCDRWQFVQGELLIDLADGIPGGAAGG
ncbi:hypothetical protein D3C86_983150 [compost metagenome]